MWTRTRTEMASSPITYADFDLDDFLINFDGGVGVGGATGTLADLTPTRRRTTASPSLGVGTSRLSTPSPPRTSTPVSPRAPLPSLTGPGVGTRPVTGGKTPRLNVGHKRPTPRRRRTTGRGGSGGGSSGGSSSSSSGDDSSSNASTGSRRRPHRMTQEELRRQLELLSNDQVQTASGRRIAGITTTNTITTTYKDGGRPQVARHSSRVSH